VFVRVAVFVTVPVSVFDSAPVSVFVAPASAESAASRARPRSSRSPATLSLLLTQLTPAATSAIAATLRILDSMSLPRWLDGSAQTLLEPINLSFHAGRARSVTRTQVFILSQVPSSFVRRIESQASRIGIILR